MKTIKANEIANFLRQYKSTFISLVTETDPKMKKGGRSGVPKFVDAIGKDPTKYTKISKMVGLVGTSVDYGTLVENRAEKKGDGKEAVELKERKWGERVDGVEVTHKGESYIVLHFVANNKPQVSFKYEGNEITLTDQEKEYLPKKKISSTQSDAGLTEDTQIVHREYKCSSIKAITVSSETYIVV